MYTASLRRASEEAVMEPVKAPTGSCPDAKDEARAMTVSPDDLEAALWGALKSARVVMLGLAGNGRLQPMTGFRDPDDGAVWFYTRLDVDLARAAEAHPGAAAVAALVYAQGGVYASIEGAITLSRDRVRIDRFWSPMVAAWQPGGKDDPDLVMLRLEPLRAEIWRADHGPVGSMLEIARALVGERPPDMGDHARVRL